MIWFVFLKVNDFSTSPLSRRSRTEPLFSSGRKVHESSVGLCALCGANVFRTTLQRYKTFFFHTSILEYIFSISSFIFLFYQSIRTYTPFHHDTTHKQVRAQKLTNWPTDQAPFPVVSSWANPRLSSWAKRRICLHPLTLFRSFTTLRSVLDDKTSTPPFVSSWAKRRIWVHPPPPNSQTFRGFPSNIFLPRPKPRIPSKNAAPIGQLVSWSVLYTPCIPLYTEFLSIYIILYIIYIDKEIF